MRKEKLIIFIDGAVSGTQYAGAAAIARSTEGYFIGWLSRQFPTMTNNEAEYHALLLGLKLAFQLNAQSVEFVSDSAVVVRQMLGHSRVLSHRLKRLHQEAYEQSGHFAHVSFRHIPRELNSLADALATEALNGQIVKMSPRRSLRLKI